VKYRLVKRRTATSNTASHGFGDYSETNWEELATCEAKSERAAQSKFKKIFPLCNLSFGGQFGPYRAWEARFEPQRV
jgi:hypothetical protein